MVDINEEVVQGMFSMMKSAANEMIPQLMQKVSEMSDAQKELLLLLINTVREIKEGKIKLPEGGEVAIEQLIKSAANAPLKQLNVNQKDYNDFKQCLEESKVLYTAFGAGESMFVYFSAKDTEKVENAQRLYAEKVKSSKSKVEIKKEVEKPSIDMVIKNAAEAANEKNNAHKNKAREAERGV